LDTQRLGLVVVLRKAAAAPQISTTAETQLVLAVAVVVRGISVVMVVTAFLVEVAVVRLASQPHKSAALVAQGLS
jgi:hypothetical protein